VPPKSSTRRPTESYVMACPSRPPADGAVHGARCCSPTGRGVSAADRPTAAAKRITNGMRVISTMAIPSFDTGNRKPVHAVRAHTALGDGAR
jgi:hypothetical protein